MSKSTLAKVLGWSAGALLVAQTVIQAQGVPHTLNDWLKLLAAVAVGAAVHHASGTDGTT